MLKINIDIHGMQEEIVTALTEFINQGEKPSREAITSILEVHTLISVIEPLKEKQLRLMFIAFLLILV